MNLTVLLAHLPLATWLGLLVSIVIPAASALLVKAHWDASVTGVLTLLLSTADGFLTQWAHAGSGFDWRAAAGTALMSWLIAALTQSKILSGTQLEARLLALGSGVTPTGSPDPTAGLDYAKPAREFHFYAQHAAAEPVATVGEAGPVGPSTGA